MNPLSRLFPVALAAGLLLPAAALAATPAHDHNHGAPATAATSPEMTTDSAAPSPTGEDRAGQLLERMRDLHERMAAARTASERQQLMADNRRLMQEAMELLRAAPAMHGKKMGKDMGMGMMDHGPDDAPPPAVATPPGDSGTGQSGGANAAPTAPDGRKRMGDMNMQQCQEMQQAHARHMELMHAVLQALVDQQVASAPAK